MEIGIYYRIQGNNIRLLELKLLKNTIGYKKESTFTHYKGTASRLL